MVHPDILEQRERLGRSFAGSLALHTAVAGSLAFYGWLAARPRTPFGDPNSLGGGAYNITPVGKLPLDRRGGQVNPVANDTPSQVPLPPAKAKPAPKAPDPDAIALKTKRTPKKLTDIAASSQRYRPDVEPKPGQLYSTAGQAMTSMMHGGTVGTGGVGVGTGSPFGARFGAYAELIRRRVAEKWRTSEVDARLQTAPPVILTFEILRDGAVRNIQIVQRSGNLALDYSAQRAVQEAAPFNPLPREYERNSASIEFWFQLKR